MGSVSSSSLTEAVKQKPNARMIFYVSLTCVLNTIKNKLAICGFTRIYYGSL